MRKAFSFFLLLLWMPHVAAADLVPEYVMKATYLYNFALYTDWPAGSGDTLNLCILGQDHFGNALDAINGKPLSHMRLKVVHISASTEIKNCQMLFLSEQDRYLAAKVIEGLGDASVLTVVEGNMPLFSGVMISMEVEDRKLVFNVNDSAARKAKLKMSSKLLRLAKTVY